MSVFDKKALSEMDIRTKYIIRIIILEEFWYGNIAPIERPFQR